MKANRFAVCNNSKVPLCRSTLVNNTQSRMVGLREIDAYGAGRTLAYVVVYSNGCIHCDHLKQALGPVFRPNYKGQNIWFIEGSEVIPGTVRGYPTIFKYQNGRRTQVPASELIAAVNAGRR